MISHRADFRPVKTNLRSRRADLKPESADFSPENANLRSRRAVLRPERVDFRQEGVWRSRFET